MSWLIQLYLNQFFLFTLILARLGGLVMTAPIYGTQEIPPQIRGFLAVALALLITPMQSAAGFVPPTDLVEMTIQIAGELLTGIALGVGLLVLFSGIQVTGQIIGQMSGLSLADVFNPTLDSEVPIFSQLLYLVTLAAFAILGGHRQVLDGLLGTFAKIPPGHVGAADTIAMTVVQLLTQSFVLGIRAAAPAMIALMLATLVLGFVGRTLPQLNLMAFGFSLNVLVTFGTFVISLAGMVWLFTEQVEPTLQMLLENIQSR